MSRRGEGQMELRTELARDKCMSVWCLFGERSRQNLPARHAVVLPRVLVLP